MIQIFDAVRETFLANFANLTRRMANTQVQLSSGLRINKPSDDPAALGDVFQLQADIGRATQVASNLGLVKSEVDTAASALSNASDLLDQVRSLGAQGANGTASASTRATLAGQVEQVLGELVNASRTTFGGKYVFSGDDPSTAPYQVDLSNPNGVDRLVTSGSTRLIQDSSGVTFAVAHSAQDIFDHRNPDDSLAPDNVFAAVNNLRVALANNDTAGINNALTQLGTAQDYLEGQLAFYGSVQNRVASALDVAQKFQIQSQTALSQVRDTDIAAATTDLASEQLSQQAALQAEANMPRSSLFDYMK
jgi:flagellar hook-associated protein 3 FlgL